MSKKTRYDFIKRKHKNYLILFYENDHYSSCDYDQELLKDFKFYNRLKDLEEKNISYMVFTNVTKIKKFDAINNQYIRYCKLFELKKILEKLVEHGIKNK